MLTNRRIGNMDLDEELQGLGMTLDSAGVNTMATVRTEDRLTAAGLGPIFEETRLRTLAEETESAPVDEGQDSIDGKFVTRDLLRRMVDLPFDQMTEDDYSELIAKFSEKELPEGDDELASLCEMMAAELIEGKRGARVRIAMRAGKRKTQQRTQQKDRNKARIRRKKPAHKKKVKKHDREEGRGKISDARVKTGRKQGKSRGELMRAAKDKFRSKKPMGRKEEHSLATELRSLLDESRAESTPFSEAQDRIYRVFELIAEMADDDGVTEVLQETWEGFTESITEDDDEAGFLEAVKPCLRVIKRCLEDIEDGDGALGEMYDGKHGKNGKGKKGKVPPQFMSKKKGNGDEDEDDDEGND